MNSIDQELYQKLVIAESALYTSSRTAGGALRDFWENFCSKLLSQYGIYDALENRLGRSPVLAEQIAFLTQSNGKADGIYADLQNLMERLNRERQKKGQKPVPLFKDKPIPATLNGNISRYFNKKRDTRQAISLLQFFRQYCNDCKHDPVERKPPFYDVTFLQTVDYFALLHKFLQGYYRNQYDLQISEYNKKIILLDGFEITKVNSSPDDQFRTHCFKECAAYYSPTSGYGNRFPAIIRMFKKSDIDPEFASRSAGVCSLVSNHSCGKGLRRIIELSGYDSDSEFYIVAYVFERNSVLLNNALLVATPFAARMEWCREITTVLCTLHNNRPKIFHRLINHNCIYLTEKSIDNTQYDPSLINLCFAKILDANAPTVYGKVMSAAEQTLLRQSTEDKYIAKEHGLCPVNADLNAVEAHWEKVDIFALGMLISDILCANISKKPHTADELRAAGVSEPLIDVVKACLSVAHMRPTAQQVLEALQK